MSGMDGRTFGSLVVAATVATNVCGSVGERVVRGSRIRLFHDGRESMQRSTEVLGTGEVELLGTGGNVVGTGVLQENIKCGMDLNGIKYFWISTAIAPPLYKVRWLKDWNSSHLTREALHFPAKGFTDKDLEIWLNKASFWAGVREYCPLSLHVFFAPNHLWI
jgi:hypothetical protein